MSETGSYELSVEGRADGIFTEDGQEIIDEIKGIYRPLIFLEEPVAVHLAQAKCYACIYAVQKKLSKIGIQMTYCNLESEEIRRFPYIYSTEELKEWFDATDPGVSKMVRISDSLEGEAPGIHPEDPLSFSLPGRPEGSGGGSLPDH